MSLWSRIRDQVVETIYPPTCAGCGLRGTWLCSLCARQVPRMNTVPTCDRCGIPQVVSRCGCQSLHQNLVAVRSLYPYVSWVPHAVHTIKYEDEFARASMFAEALAEEIAALGPLDGMIPIPLHDRKLRDRGYNQAEKLASAAADLVGIPVTPIVIRHRKTKSQVSLSGRERSSNVSGAFSIDPAYVPRSDARYVLIDDVRTTGATLNGCATALASVGITRVMAVTIAVDLYKEHLDRVMELGLRSGVGDK